MYSFLSNDLSLRVKSEGDVIIKDSPLDHVLIGTNRRNLNEIMRVLEKGKYTLVLYQPVLPLQPHCISYGLSVHIAPADGHDPRSMRCSMYDMAHILQFAAVQWYLMI